jgi:hypothetical protein
MDSKMIKLRFDDFTQNESNIYVKLAKEKEKNMVLFDELQRYENERALSSDKSPQ